jgi:hypothetical protein
MYTQEQLKGFVFFDLETASEYETLDSLSIEKPKMADIWSKRCDYLRKKWPEDNGDKTDEELYLDKAALTPEFNRIVCASFGRLDFNGLTPKMIIKSFSGPGESEILDGIEKVVEKFSKYTLVGHNIKRFDIPVMCKRFIINGYTLPSYLQVHNKKPWEMPFIDTSESWSFGAWQESFVSLELLMVSLGLDTPKDDIRGEEVSEVFWKTGDHQRIMEYCEKDVYALAQALLRMSGLTLMNKKESSLV